MNNNAVCRTAPTTTGLLKSVGSTVLRILNLEGHKNCMIGLNVTTILPIFFLHHLLGLYWILNQSTVDNWGVSRGRSEGVVGFSDG